MIEHFAYGKRIVAEGSSSLNAHKRDYREETELNRRWRNAASRAPFERPDKVQLRQEIEASRPPGGDPLQRSVEVIGMASTRRKPSRRLPTLPRTARQALAYHAAIALPDRAYGKAPRLTPRTPSPGLTERWR